METPKGAPGEPPRQCPPRRCSRARCACTARAARARPSNVPRSTHRTVGTGTLPDTAVSGATLLLLLLAPAGMARGSVRPGSARQQGQGAGGSGHGQSHLGKHPRAGSCYLQCWWPRSCPRCPRHRRCGRPPRGRRTAGARAPRGSARARGPPPGIAPSPARRGPSPVRGRPPASPRCHSPAGGTQRQLWRGWCRWRTRGPTSPRAAPPGARCSCCCPPPDAAALQQQGTGGRGTIGTGGAARTPRAAGPAPHPAQGSQCSPT